MRPYVSVDGVDFSDGLIGSEITSSCKYVDKTAEHRGGTIIAMGCTTAVAMIEQLKVIDRHCGLNLFRGQADADFTLLPSAHRTESRIAKLAKANVTEGCRRLVRYRWLQETAEQFTRRVELALRSFFQFDAIRKYQEVCRELKIGDYDVSRPYGNSVAEVTPSYDQIVSYLKSDTVPWLRCTSNSRVRLQAQHHGIDTPLLDFTSSYQVALDFATRDIEKLENKRIAVWSIIASPTLDLYHAFDISSPYFQSQRSYMLVNPSADKTYYEFGSWIPFENRLSNTMPLGTVFKLTLPYSELESLRSRFHMFHTPLYMMGTPMYESTDNIQYRIQCLRTEFVEKVWSKVRSHIEWENVPNDETQKSEVGLLETNYCSDRCNDHCNTLFSTTFQ